MGGQLLALLRLRYLLFLHGFTAGKAVSVVILAALGLAALACSIVLTGFAFTAARYAVKEEGPDIVLAILDAGVLVFALFWIWGLMFELQRNDPIDLRRMLFLPVSLRMVYFLNFLVSLFSPALAFFLFPLLGLIGGLAWYVHPVMLLSLPAAVLFYMMAGAWSYYVRGIIGILMENKRRRRLVLTIVPLVFVLISQLPYLLGQSNLVGKLERILAGAGIALNEETGLAWLRLGNLVLPPGWLPYTVYGLLQGEWLVAAGTTLGLGILATAGLAIGYRTTVRHYMGAGQVGSAEDKHQSKPGAVPLTARSIPLFSGEVAALTLANFLSYLRHPNIRMLLIMPLAMGALLLFVYAPRISGEDANPIARAFLPAAILVWPFFNFGAIIFNIFGIDRHGFRALVLLPAPRYRYLLAKNLALFPFVGGLGFAFVGIGFAFSGSAPQTLLIAILQVVQLYLLFCSAGNVISIYFPYAIAADSMRASAASTTTALIGFGSSLLVIVLLIPSALCLVIDDLLRYGWSYQGPSVGVIASLVMISLSVLLYRLALTYAGGLLQQREQRMLATLVRDNA
jgi:hypothetical protein